MSRKKPGAQTKFCLWNFWGALIRDECLNVNWFLSLEDARDKIETWRTDYNEYRPHSSLDYKTPSDFARSGAF